MCSRCAHSPPFVALCERGWLSHKYQAPVGYWRCHAQLLNLSRHASDEEAQLLTSLLIYNLVERSGGQVQFTAEEIRQMREKLPTKMVQIQLGQDLRLRIIDRLPELQYPPLLIDKKPRIWTQLIGGRMGKPRHTRLKIDEKL